VVEAAVDFPIDARVIRKNSGANAGGGRFSVARCERYPNQVGAPAGPVRMPIEDPESTENDGPGIDIVRLIDEAELGLRRLIAPHDRKCPGCITALGRRPALGGFEDSGKIGIFNRAVIQKRFTEGPIVGSIEHGAKQDGADGAVVLGRSFGRSA
jgi:hypothetical protein